MSARRGGRLGRRARSRSARILQALGWVALASLAWFVGYALLVLGGR